MKLLDDQLNLYIGRVLKQVHPDTSIGNTTCQQVADFIDIVVKEIAATATKLALMAGKKTISSREIQAAVRLILPGELCKHAVSEGTKAITKFNSYAETNKNVKSAPVRSNVKAGLVVSVSLIRNYIKSQSAMNIGAGSPVYLAGVAEYLIAEIMELAGNAARDSKVVTIKIRHVMMAIENDEELHALKKHFNIFFLGAGVLPRIEAALIPTEQEKNKQAAQRRKNNKDKEKDDKAPHRFLPGTVALQKIRKLQKSNELLLPRLPFRRLVLEVLQDYTEGEVRVPERSMLIIQEFFELVSVNMFAEAQRSAIRADRETLYPKDFLTRKVFHDIGNVANFYSYSKTGPRKVLRDNINGITQPAIQRLAHRGGVKRLSNLVYTEYRGILKYNLETFLYACVVTTSYLRSKTITPEIIRSSSQSLGCNLLVFEKPVKK